MPIYHFELEDGTRLTDPTDLRCMDDNDAKTNANFIVRQVAYDALSKAYRGRSSWSAMPARRFIE